MLKTIEKEAVTIITCGNQIEMSLNFAGIAPHGFSIIEEVSGPQVDLFKPIRQGMEMLGSEFNKQSIDTIVILTPHGLRLKGHHGIYMTDICKGDLTQFGQSVHLEMTCDKPFAQDILNACLDQNIPLVGCYFGAMSGEKSNIPMDWGTLIPLWFCGGRNEKKPEIVVISPTRETSYNELVEMGQIIGRLAEQSQKRIALIASADQGHCHLESGPYGFAKESHEIDEQIQLLIQSHHLEAIYTIDQKLIDKGKPDSIWQLLILHGALGVKPLNHHFVTYQVPTYFGMLVAYYD